MKSEFPCPRVASMGQIVSQLPFYIYEPVNRPDNYLLLLEHIKLVLRDISAF